MGGLPPKDASEAARAWSQAIRAAKTIEVVAPYLLDDGVDWVLRSGVLGISKPFLLRVFIALTPKADWESVSRTTAEYTLVGLIATTEHLTIINLRKRLVVAGTIPATFELHVLNVLLGSPSHNHNKSPLLWSHRRWLLARIGIKSLRSEFAVIAAAGTHHGANYYAWAHARWAVARADADNSRDFDRSDLGAWMWELCRQNLSDVSMWTFLASIAPQYCAEATDLNQRYPHEAIRAYLSAVARP